MRPPGTRRALPGEYQHTPICDLQIDTRYLPKIMPKNSGQFKATSGYIVIHQILVTLILFQPKYDKNETKAKQTISCLLQLRSIQKSC